MWNKSIEFGAKKNGLNWYWDQHIGAKKKEINIIAIVCPKIDNNKYAEQLT